MRIIQKIKEFIMDAITGKSSTTDNTKVDTRYESVIRNIKAMPGKDVKVSSDEETFIRELISRLDQRYDSYNLSLQRLSDKTLNVYYNSSYLGKIKLQGGRTYMQIINGFHGLNVIQNLALNDYLNSIDLWMEQIKHLEDYFNSF